MKTQKLTIKTVFKIANQLIYCFGRKKLVFSPTIEKGPTQPIPLSAAAASSRIRNSNCASRSTTISRTNNRKVIPRISRLEFIMYKD
jgi:hypothetical protein